LHEGLETADRAAIDDLFSDKYTNESTFVNASGTFEPVSPSDAHGNVTPATKTTSSDPPIFYMAGIESPNRTGDLMKSIAAALARPKIQAYIKNKVALLAEKPSVKTAPFTMKSVAPAKELPKGSLDYEITVARSAWESAPDPKAKTLAAPPLKLHLLVAPGSGGAAWTLLGFDRARLAALAKATIDGTNDADTIASRPEIAALHDDKFVGAGFTTLAALLDPWTKALMPGASSAHDKPNVLAGTPNRGQTPILLRSRVTTDGGLRSTLDFTVPRGAIEDAVIFATTSSLLGIAGP
jgi:hypothetical protein